MSNQINTAEATVKPEISRSASFWIGALSAALVIIAIGVLEESQAADAVTVDASTSSDR